MVVMRKTKELGTHYDMTSMSLADIVCHTLQYLGLFLNYNANENS